MTVLFLVALTLVTRLSSWKSGVVYQPSKVWPLRVGAARVVAFLVQELEGLEALFLPPFSSYSMV